MTGGDKNILFTPKISITEEDLETVPGLKDLVKEIEIVQKRQRAAKGKDKYILTKQLK
jgi:rRNA pseudouridine-1189 N-methylase Emg1 (Nep1/Mra1 family)